MPHPSIILKAVEDDYQMILHASLCPNVWISTRRKGEPKAAPRVRLAWILNSKGASVSGRLRDRKVQFTSARTSVQQTLWRPLLHPTTYGAARESG